MVAKADMKSTEVGNLSKSWEVHSSLRLYHMVSILDAEHAAYSMITFRALMYIILSDDPR